MRSRSPGTNPLVAVVTGALLVLAVAGCDPDAEAPNSAASPDGAATSALQAEVAALEGELEALAQEIDQREDRIAELEEQVASATNEPPLAPSEPDADPVEDAQTVGEPERPFTPEGLKDSLRSYFLGESHDPGSTEWRESSLSLPSALTDENAGTATLGALALGLVDAAVEDESFAASSDEPTFPWEVTVRALAYDDDEAAVVVQKWGGMQDDAQAGVDYRFSAARGDTGWHVTGVEERTQCARGVDTDTDVCI